MKINICVNAPATGETQTQPMQERLRLSQLSVASRLYSILFKFIFKFKDSWRKQIQQIQRQTDGQMEEAIQRQLEEAGWHL